MTSITIYLDPATEARLRLIADETDRQDDPGRTVATPTPGASRSAMEISL